MCVCIPCGVKARLLTAVCPLLFVVVAPPRTMSQSATTLAQRAAGQDCESIKQEIQSLQDSLARLTVDAETMQSALNDINKQIATLQLGVRFFSGPGLSETARGEALDQLATAMNDRTRMEQDLEDVNKMIQATKDAIADLLSKLANCGPPSATQPQVSGAQMVPASNAPPPSSAAAQPSESTTPVPTAGEDCESIEQEIQTLQDSLAKLTVDAETMQSALNDINKQIATLQQGVRFFSGPGLSETARGEALDQLATAMNDRTRMEQDLEDVNKMIQATKDAIADLLSKLANCGPPSTAQPQQQTPQNATPAPPPPPNPPTPPTGNKSVSMSGFTPTFQLRGFGGPSFIHGNTPATSGFDGAVLFPLGNHILIGPTGGFRWINSSIVQTVGSQQPGSTFINTSAGFKQGNFGGGIQIPFMFSHPTGVLIDIHGGATVAHSAITQAEGFCGLGNATSPAGCHALSTTTTNDTVVGPFLGGFISHSIFPHIGVFAGYDYLRLKDTTSAGASGASTGPHTIFDLHYNEVGAGLVLTLSRNHER